MMSKASMAVPRRFGQYRARGDYHRHLDPTWRYYPVYVEKMRRVHRFLEDRRSARILDAGCGEGVLVNDYRNRGYDIIGLDQNYQAQGVMRGSVLSAPFADASFDVVLCLDVLEHLSLLEQRRAIAELHRLLRPGGILLATIPNLGHLASRLRFLVTGRLIRTSTEEHHPGDRPYAEWKQLLGERFEIESSRGIFPTFPLLALLTHLAPGKALPFHRVYNALCSFPSICFLGLFECRKR